MWRLRRLAAAVLRPLTVLPAAPPPTRAAGGKVHDVRDWGRRWKASRRPEAARVQTCGHSYKHGQVLSALPIIATYRCK